ncbi:MAG: endonuclease V [Planctomycetes bacterium]|nr:endonuclease V [Planctomycetota bacterium]
MRWPAERTLSIEAARRQQRELAARVREAWELSAISTIAGVDVSVRGERAAAAVVVFAWPSLAELERSVCTGAVEFPYVPGLLAFREVPLLVRAVEALRVRPDLLLVDGHGRAHPRRCGVASHLGVILGLPTIGSGKSRLCGAYRTPAARRGASTRLVHDGEVVARVLRTREGVAPLFVSIGHRVDLAHAVRIVLRATRGTRLPEPIRAAHAAAGSA